MIYCTNCGNEHKDFEAIQVGPASLMGCDYCKADLSFEDITEIIPFVIAVIFEATARAAQSANTFAVGGLT